MKIFIAVVFLLASGLYAQKAKVIALTPEEQKQALEIKDLKESLAKKESCLYEKIYKNHDLSTKGWGGFEYSEDYKYIVPTITYINNTFVPYNNSCSCLDITPVTGSFNAVKKYVGFP